MKIVLVNVGFGNNGFSDFVKMPPLGLLSIAGAVSTSHQIKIIDLTVEEFSDEQLRKEFSHTDLVGVNCLHDSIIKSARISKIAKECGAKTVFGGVHVTLAPELIELKAVDYVVRGEGEITFKELVDAIEHHGDFQKILGLSYWDSNQNRVIHNSARPLIEDLDTLPFPRYDLIDIKKYGFFGLHYGALETSRGCSFGCDFCCVTQMYHRSYRAKSVKRVIEEYRRYANQFDWIFNVDDNYVTNWKRTMELCDAIIASNLNLKQLVQARADTLASHPELMDKMQKAGVKSVFLGIESMDPDALKSMNKGVTNVKLVENAIDGLQQRGISVFASLIAGIENYYHKAKSNLMHTIDFLVGHDVDILLLNPLICFPSTPFYAESVKKQWVKPYSIKENYMDCFPKRPDLSVQQLFHLVDMGVKRFYLNPRYFLKFGKMRRVLNPKWWWLSDPALIWAFAQAGTKMVQICLKDSIMKEYFQQYEETLDAREFH